MAEGAELADRWAAWVQELDDHPLDKFEYLGLLSHRDALATWLEVHGDGRTRDTVDEIDADFEALTIEDSRYTERFSAQAGSGWWWRRLPADPEALRYVTRDW
jgi:hypothetical protein